MRPKKQRVKNSSRPFFLFYVLNRVIGKNTAQTDEEKQRERQRNERELKHAELEAQHLKVRYSFGLLELFSFILNAC